VAAGHADLIRPPEAFPTLAAPTRAEIREKGSRFVAAAFPAAGEEEARLRLEEIEAAEPDATHHAWAWRLGAGEGAVERSHDAGEPRGTAGPPVLDAIHAAGLSNLVVVVSRWFGGTRLGKGGLARAYRAAARAALEGAPVASAVPLGRLRVELAGEHDGPVRHLVARRGGRIDEATYDGRGRAALTIVAPAGVLPALRSEIESLARGSARFEPPEPPARG
jgi:putative IMPACT (imprinted ancient) family translation regulator